MKVFMYYLKITERVIFNFIKRNFNSYPPLEGAGGGTN